MTLAANIAVAPEFAAASRSLAANQGLYNGFLACVIVAGVFGAVTGSARCRQAD